MGRTPHSVRAQGDGTKVTEKAQNADFGRQLQIFADSPLLPEIQAYGACRKPQKTADSHRKPQIFAENRRKLQIGLRHLGSVSFSSALHIHYNEFPQEISPQRVSNNLPELSGNKFSHFLTCLNGLSKYLRLA